jgi:hypothetical protein
VRPISQVSDDLPTDQKNPQEISDLISEIVLNGPLIGAGQESTKKSQKQFTDSFPKWLRMVRIQVTGNQQSTEDNCDA